MTCVEYFKHRDEARIQQQILKDHGIPSRVIVDPLESRSPALSSFQDVALMVQDDRLSEAKALLRKAA